MNLCKHDIMSYPLLLSTRLISLRIDQVKPLHIVDFLENRSENGMRLDGKEGKLSSGTITFAMRRSKLLAIEVLNNINIDECYIGVTQGMFLEQADRETANHFESFFEKRTIIKRLVS